MIKKLIERAIKIFKYAFLIAFTGASLYLANLFLMKPYSIDHYLGKELVMGLVDSPEALTYIGIFDDFNWLTRHNSRLSIPADGDLENDIKEIEKGIKTLYKYKD